MEYLLHRVEWPWCGFEPRLLQPSTAENSFTTYRTPPAAMQSEIVLTFVLKNGMNIPHKEFYGLFVPFFNVAAMGVTAELIVGPAVETGGSGI
ncbi:hypothetical protein [Rhizobium miluonense]|uniref:hypothetical protein n=1 Tax=Rhizobium miluonense TaxID=411945 RepID=UPI0011129F65|nr:hypothetical protein [Rhizobium miluonense]